MSGLPHWRMERGQHATFTTSYLQVWSSPLEDLGHRAVVCLRPRQWLAGWRWLSLGGSLSLHPVSSVGLGPNAQGHSSGFYLFLGTEQPFSAAVFRSQWRERRPRRGGRALASGGCAPCVPAGLPEEEACGAQFTSFVFLFLLSNQKFFVLNENFYIF